MSKSYTGGLNFDWPVKGDVNWDQTADAALTEISAHDHSGSGNGTQIGTTGLANDGVTGTKIRLDNAQYLRARNAANNADLNLLRADAGDLLDIARVARFSSSETLTSSGAISLTTNLTILNGSSLAMTLANGAEGQLKYVVNINATSATVTPSTTAGPNEVKLYQYGAVLYVYLSGEWRVVRGNLQGTPTNDNATAGDIGEQLFISRVQSAATSLTTGTAANIGTTTSITLTPGDWDVRGAVGFLPAATTSITKLISAVSKTSATLPAADTSAVPTAGELLIARSYAAFVPGANEIAVDIPTFRVSVSTNTALFLIGRATFTVSTMTGFGYLEARRVR